MARICIITAGHLATCPRMLKAADALSESGHQVRVVSARFVDWATGPDVALVRSRPWSSTVVDYSAASGGALRVTSALRQRAAHLAVSTFGVSRMPVRITARAFSRIHDELVAAALSEPADFFYGGTTGALAAAAEAADRAGVPFAVDLEDFYRGENPEPEGHRWNRLAERIENRVLPRAACVTTASAGISAEYARCCGIEPVTINNTFSLPTHKPRIDGGDPARLRFYWFSQTIGAGRGLEDAINAIGLSDFAATLAIRGRARAGYVDTLRTLAARVAPRLELSVLPPLAPEDLIRSCEGFDIGLSVEEPLSRNRDLCLSNKALTYILAGLALVLTDTIGQRQLAGDVGEGAIVYPSGRPRQLAERLRVWAVDRAALLAAKRATWDAAVRRWHWNHPAERGALIAAVRAALP